MLIKIENDNIKPKDSGKESKAESAETYKAKKSGEGLTCMPALPGHKESRVADKT